jgi:hypothetical protein
VRGVPTELFILLLFGIALLFNWAMQRAARRQRAEAARQAPLPDQPVPQEIPEPPWPLRRDADLPPPGMPVASPYRAAAPIAAPSRRRFNRQTLFGDRRRLQDAFVAATILGRCRADEPHEIG